MSKKFITIYLLAIFIITAAYLTPVFAKNFDNNGNRAGQDLPETEGVYDVPGHPNLKVRVFVHKAKGNNGKPNPAPEPTLQCELDDPVSTAPIGATGWHLPSNWTYRLNPASVPSTVGPSNLTTIAAAAFSQWTGAIPNKVNVTPGPNTSASRASFDGQNIIAWGRTSGNALGVTYTWYYPSTGVVAEVDTIMNKKFTWYWSEGTTECAYTNVYDAQNILTHELGHWFGLDDHYTSDYVNNTMYGYGSKTETKKNTLTSGDITGIQAIYP